MKQYISIIALFLGSSAAIKLNQEFIEQLSEIKSQNDVHYNKQAMAQSSAKARWVELPDCKGGQLGEDDVPLKEDLSNAIIATCKSYNPNYVEPSPSSEPPSPPPPTATQAYQTQYGQNYSYWQPAQIYDDVIKTSKPLVEHEHQVTQHQDGHVETTDGSDGPKGDWYSYGKPSGGEEWPTEKYNQLVQIYQNSEDPEDIQVIQLTKSNGKKAKWVELPTCKGDSGEVSLNQDLSNATVASCKKEDQEYIHSPDLED